MNNQVNHLQELLNGTDRFLAESRNNILFCEGIDDGFYETITGLSKKYPRQCYELPCSENSMVGMALSASSYEVTTILCFQRVEFALLAIEQFANNSCKINFLSNGKRANPCLFRLVIGRGWGQGPSHSQSFETMFAQIPQLNVFMPAFPSDSKYILENFNMFINPTISLEHRWIHYSYDIGRNQLCDGNSYIVKEGKDVTIIAYSYNVLLAYKVSEILLGFSINIEIVNLFKVSGYDSTMIKESVKKTGRVIAIDLDKRNFSISDQIFSDLFQVSDIRLKSKPIKLANRDGYSPSSREQAKEYYLTIIDIAKAIISTLNIESGKAKEIEELVQAKESQRPSDVPNSEFLGPF
ncbi:transketolase C-terminal domain-containing protein [Prochlorococcus sp. MIT 1306]|uniref:transketolase C-terminal domain-containing protein n=1 Tax=Prochlorococcus sp. MIT 1306 TaxID=1799667 RepID=UPI0007B32FD1|nr:transketolase C-terminal domain-containing protein [Prochlorococcus sp. MIT 1306]KZR61075.1 Pyruvate dehydrogenase E1 component subunit beta [Prochlorococcus sp. MIT 1306]